MLRRNLLSLSAPALVSLTSSGCSSSNSPHQLPAIQLPKAIADLEEQLPQRMAGLQVPSVSLAIILDNKLAYRKAFGVKDTTSRAPVDTDTVFEAQSMSKPVFSYRVLKLAESGVLDLDAPLTKYLPTRLIPGDPRLDLITARRVLCHTTGLPNWRSRQDPLRIHFTPGAKFQYSGEAYNYLQLALTALTGHTDSRQCATFESDYKVCATDFAEHMRTNLLNPFGMTSSDYIWTNKIGKNLAIAHDTQGRPAPRPRNTAVDVARYGSAGALLTTPSDYAKFLLEIMNPQPADNFRLNAESRSTMLKPHIKVEGGPFPLSYALGWQVWPTPAGLTDGVVFAHGGDVTGYHCQSAFSLTRRRAFVVMTNGDNGAELISKHLLKDLVTHFA